MNATRWALPALAALAAACAQQDGARLLPADRSPVVSYVALGDSTVEGVGASRPELNYVSRIHARLRAVYPSARLTNLGVGGATSGDVLARQLDRAIERRPHLVTLSVGPNDITTGVRVETYEKNLETILGRLARETTAVVVANLIPDLALTPRFNRRRERDAVAALTIGFNDVLARRARAHGVQLVDLYAASRRELPQRPELVWSDGYHPSDAGYARWAELLWEGIEARIAPR
ncbi:MAG TPA: SGNH/GDSL hydrolase family protein [Methylomirabilota bacterium]|nr:SGNH/GDSL hydrolase family protein [Methylomirabilota bacterium]